MAQVPSGTITFLFTDMEGSTRLAREFPHALPGIQARYTELFQAAISAHNGYIFQVIGDEIDAAFETALDALLAALAAQKALGGEDWGEVGSIRVRMGLHTGPAKLRGDIYDGYLTLSHTKRLMSVAYGGQILLSEATETLLRESLPPDASLRSLGEHRLKDFEHAEAIFQVLAKDLRDDFPPLKTPGSFPNNLPVQLTSFIGREKELGEVRALLAQERLVTLIGPGGSGKTRLALQAAAGIAAGQEQFPDGVFFVALAPISDPGLVASTIAQAIGLTESAGRSIADHLEDHLRNKSLLLVLDNFEQVIQSAALVARLMAACSELRVLVTSREGLRVSGEREYPVPPLAVPDPSQALSPASISQYAAVELFLQRVKAVKPDFKISEETVQAVAEICIRLDGLPLAIELAAARIKLLPPKAMLARLENRLDILTGGGRDLPARQQTLRNAIAWSYDLLDESEQQLFRRLSVFVGGCTLDAVEAVVDGDSGQPSILDQLGSLLDKSLLREMEGQKSGPRFLMLETLREFGLEQLQASGEREPYRRRHAGFFLALAEQAEKTLRNSEQLRWMDLLEREHDNLRAALEWSCREGGTDQRGEECLRLAAALGLFWEARGYFNEGRERLAGILEHAFAQGSTALHAKLLARAGELAYRQSDYAATTRYASQSLGIFRALGDRHGAASALLKLGNAATEVGDYPAATESLKEALSTWRELGDQHGISRALISFGWAALRAGDYGLAKERLAEALNLSRDLGDARRIGFELAGLGEVALREGDYQRAAQLAEESLELRRQLGNKWGIGVSLGILGWVAMREENWSLAMVRLGESLEVRRDIGDQSGCAWCLERLAAIAMAQGQAEKAARLFGAAAGLRSAVASVIDPADQPAYESKIRALRKGMGAARYEEAWNAGRRLALEQAVAYALER